MAQDFQSYQTLPDYNPPPEPKRNTNRTIMIIIGVLLLLCCCCIVFALLMYFVLGDLLTDALGITQILVPLLNGV